MTPTAHPESEVLLRLAAGRPFGFPQHLASHRGARVLLLVCLGWIAAQIGCTEPLAPTTPAHLEAVFDVPTGALAGEPLALPPGARVTTSDGRPVQGVTVTFSVQAGGGTVIGAQQTTDGNGVAMVEGWRMGEVVGTNVLSASSGDLEPVSFTVVSVPGPPAIVTLKTAPSATAQNRAAFATQPVVQLKDVHGNVSPVAGVTINAAMTAGSGALDGTRTIATTADGVASFTDLSIRGPAGDHVLTFASVGLTSASASVSTTAGPAATLERGAGNNQSVAAGTAVPVRPAVRVLDLDGNPVRGDAITFAVVSGGGTVSGASQTTDDAGIATVGNWTLGTTVGANTLQATSASLGSTNVTFSATGVPGAPAKLAVSRLPSSSVQNRAVFGTQPVIQLQDTYGNAVARASIAVSVAITAGGGTLGGTTTAQTVADGKATFTNLSIAGTVGTRTLTFTAPTLTSATASVTTTPGAASAIAVNAGDNQTATVGTAVSTAPSVKITDADGNGVSGVAVTFAVASGGGSASGTARTTAASGIASVGGWTLGTTAGANTLTATSTGLTGSPVTFSATGTAGAATQLALSTAPSATAQSGVPFATQPVVQLRDQYGNARAQAGVTISATITAGGGTLGGSTSATTDNSGAAAFTNLSISGSVGTRTLAFSSNGLTSVSATVDVAAGTAYRVDPFAGDQQSATVGEPVPIAPSAKVTDESGNPVAGATVRFQVSEGGGSITGAEQQTDADGIATVGSWTLGTVAGQNKLTAIVPDVSVIGAEFMATANAGPAAKLVLATPPSSSAQNRVPFAVQPVVKLQDSYSNAVTTEGVPVTVAITSGEPALLGTTSYNTDALGVAFGDLAIGGVVGVRELTFSSPGLTSVTAAVTITAGAASAMAVNDGDGQSAGSGVAVSVPPSVKITDVDGNAVADVAVTFAVASGGGSVTGENAVSDAVGVARVGSWTLGPQVGGQTLTATSDGLTGSPVTFTATAHAVPSSIEIYAGDGQTATVATAVTTPPSVLVKDQSGAPLPDALVTFTVATGGGSVTAESQVTDVWGVASVGSWTLGTTAGQNTLTASASGLVTTVTFTATGEPDVPASMSVQGGDGQTATVGTAVSVAPSVKVTDQYGNGIAGIAVSFAVASGGGSITGETATTDGDGIATVGSWTLGTVAGSNTLTVTSPALPSASLTIGATGTPAAAAAITITTPPPATVPNRAVLDPHPVVQLRDTYGNAVAQADVQVTAGLGQGSGSLAGTTQVNTAADGTAEFTDLSIRGPAGAKQLTFSAASIGSVAFDITTTAGAASAVVIVAGDGQTATVGTAVSTPPSVRVTDADANAVSGVSVTFAVASGGGSVSGESQTSDGDGIATVGSWTLGTVKGTNTLTATAADVSTPATFTAQGVAGAVVAIAAYTGDGQTAPVGTPVPIAPSVIVTDQYGNGVEGVVVVFAVSSGGGSVTGENASTGTDGVAAVGSWTLGASPGVNTLSATSGTLSGSPVTFSATATDASTGATALSLTTPPSASAQNRAAFATQPVVQLMNGLGSPYAQAGVEVTAAITSGGGTLGGTTTVSTAADGSATFTDLYIAGTVGTRTITFSASGLSSATADVTTTAGAPSSMAGNGGDGQTVDAGTDVPVKPSVLVADVDGNPVQGVQVTFTPQSNSGSVTGGVQSTGANGVATVGSWTLYEVPATNTLNATATALPTVSFTATGVATLLQSGVSVAGISATTGHARYYRIVVPDGAQELNVVITGGTGDADLYVRQGALPTLNQGEFDCRPYANGNEESCPMSYPTAGDWYVMLHAYSTFSGVTLTATNALPGANRVDFSLYPTSAAQNRVPLSGQPVLQILDQFGSPYAQAGIPVTATIVSGGGSLGGTTTVNTDVNGTATFTDLYIAGAVGVRTLRFDSPGLTSSPIATVVVSAGVATNMAAYAGDGQHGEAGTMLPISPAVVITDADGNRVRDVEVTYAVLSGGGSTDGSIFYSDADGIAALYSWTLGPSAGTNTLTASASGLIGSPVTFTATGHTALSRIEYGTVDAKIYDLNVGDVAAPLLRAYDALGGEVSDATFTFQSRSTSVAGVNGAGSITLSGSGSTFVVATGNGTQTDSVFVQAPSSSGPVLRTDVARMRYQAGDIITVDVILDMRGATLGAATLSLVFPSAYPGFLNFVDAVDGSSGLGTVTELTSGGMLRMNVTSASGATGVLHLATVRFQVQSSSAGRSGFITLVPQDVVDIDFNSLTSSVSALRYPMVVVP